MAKTFRDINGEKHVLDIDNYDYTVDYDQDILSNEVSGYYIIKNDFQIPVSKEVYDAVEDYLNNL